jgi:membrane-bound lytic murein transglycosylase D
MLKRLKNILPGACLFVLLALMVEFLNFSTSGINENNSFNQNYKVLPVPLPDTMNFAGEPVPMNHLGVRENLEQEMLVNIYWQSQTMLALKRANRYFPEIEKILRKNGIPADFKYLAMAESGFSYKASPAGAAGFWQILKSTALANGLEVGKEIDERYNLEKSTEAACTYFKQAYSEFHNWTLVAASYNMGMGGVAKAIAFQKQANYYDLGLNTETSRYIYRILALKEVQSNPEKFGFYIKSSELYPLIPTIQVIVDSSIENLADYAISMHVNYRILKILNPWLISSSLSNPDKETYIISLPKTDAIFFDLGENIIFNDTNAGRVSQCLMDTSAKVQNTCSSKIIVHFVKKDETLQTIAGKYNVSIEQLRSWNTLADTATVRVNDEIILFKDTK